MLKLFTARLERCSLRPNLLTIVALIDQLSLNRNIYSLICIATALLGLVLHVQAQLFENDVLFDTRIRRKLYLDDEEVLAWHTVAVRID